MPIDIERFFATANSARGAILRHSRYSSPDAPKENSRKSNAKKQIQPVKKSAHSDYSLREAVGAGVEIAAAAGIAAADGICV